MVLTIILAVIGTLIGITVAGLIATAVLKYSYKGIRALRRGKKERKGARERKKQKSLIKNINESRKNGAKSKEKTLTIAFLKSLDRSARLKQPPIHDLEKLSSKRYFKQKRELIKEEIKRLRSDPGGRTVKKDRETRTAINGIIVQISSIEQKINNLESKKYIPESERSKDIKKLEKKKRWLNKELKNLGNKIHYYSSDEIKEKSRELDETYFGYSAVAGTLGTSAVFMGSSLPLNKPSSELPSTLLKDKSDKVIGVLSLLDPTEEKDLKESLKAAVEEIDDSAYPIKVEGVKDFPNRSDVDNYINS